MEYIPIIILATLSLLLLGVAIIIGIRNKQKILQRDEDKDFIDAFKEKKTKKLNTYHSSLSFKTYIAMIIGLPVVVAVAGWFLIENKAIVLLIALACVFIPDGIITVMRAKRASKFEEQYARALKLFASCLRAKMTIPQSVADVCNSPYIDEDVKAGFRQIDADLAIGIDVKEAFTKFAEDTGSMDAQDVASAIAMQDEIGGGEAQIIETLANSIQQRISMRKEIKTLFSETSVMVTFMDFAPFIVLLIMYFGTPQFIAPYFESTKMTLLLFGMLGFTIIGSFIIRAVIASAKKGGVKK